MADRETIIRLSLTVERLRAQVRDAEEQLAKRRGLLAEAIGQLDAALSTGDSGRETDSDRGAGATTTEATKSPHWVLELLAKRRTRHEEDQTSSPLLQLTNPALLTALLPSSPPHIEYPGADTKKRLRENLLELFVRNPRKSFTMADVELSLNLPQVRNVALRQALKRLFDEGTLLRERDGVYMLNPFAKLPLARAAGNEAGSIQPANTGTKKEDNNRPTNESSKPKG